MKHLLLSALVLLCTAATAQPLTGDWKQVDLRGIENTPPACVRLWFEERSYALQKQNDQMYGVYANLHRITPVGAPSFQPNCKYPPPATKPLSLQTRMWNLAVRPDGNRLRIAAEPGIGSGDMNLYKTEAFNTVVSVRNGLLVDGDLLFRRPSTASAAARQKLEETINRLEGGGCLEVMASMGRSDIAEQACDLRRRIGQYAGRYTGLSVISALEFDRIPEKFPMLSTAMKNQRGIHYSFNGQYERQTIPGDALVFEEGGSWRVAFLWF